MVKKLFLVTLFSLIMGGTGFAQRTSLGYDYLRIGEYESAATFFQQQLTQNPAEANFYLGEIAFKQGDFSKAESYYKTGLAAGDKGFMNEVGLAKLELRNNAKAGESALKAILKKDKKNVDLMITVGYAYLDNNMYDKALEMVAAAQKVSLQDPLIYILKGDVMVKTNDNPGVAAADYESAITFDDNFILGYIKYADVYARVEPAFAASRLETLIQKNPECMLAYRDLGIIYRKIGQYNKAVFVFREYFNAGIYTFNDIAEYGFALYFANQYKDAMVTINKGLEIKPEDFILNRLRMYVASRLGDYENGITYAEKFFSIPLDGRSYLTEDYVAYANILGGVGRFDEAIVQFNNAVDAAETIDAKIQTYDQFIQFATGVMRDNGLAADLFTRSLALRDQELTDVADYVLLGVYYYNAMNTKTEASRQVVLNRRSDSGFVGRVASDAGVSAESLMNNDELFVSSAVQYYANNANATFDRVIELAPTSYLGYLYRARIAMQKDEDMVRGDAKPFYEKVVWAINESGDQSNQAVNALIEAYKYLGVYYYKENQLDKSLEFFRLIQGINPDDDYAKRFIEVITNFQKSQQ